MHAWPCVVIVGSNGKRHGDGAETTTMIVILFQSVARRTYHDEQSHVGKGQEDDKIMHVMMIKGVNGYGMSPESSHRGHAPRPPIPGARWGASKHEVGEHPDILVYVAVQKFKAPFRLTLPRPRNIPAHRRRICRSTCTARPRAPPPPGRAAAGIRSPCARCCASCTRPCRRSLRGETAARLRTSVRICFICKRKYMCVCVQQQQVTVHGAHDHSIDCVVSAAAAAAVCCSSES